MAHKFLTPIALNDTNTRLEKGGGNSIKAVTNSGYIEVGPQNSSHAHFITNRGNFYFNKFLYVDTGIVSSYDEDLSLRRAASDAGSINLNIGMLYSKSINDSQLQLGGFTINTALEDTYHCYIPGVSPNIFAGATKRLTVAATKNGTAISNASMLNAFLAHEETVSISTANTDTIIIEISGFVGNYGQWYGIAFGAAQWRAKDIDIEISSDNGSNYTSIYSENNQPHATVRTYYGGSSTGINKIKYTLTNWNTTSTRINHIFGYKYLQGDTNYLDKYMNSSIYASINFKDNYPATFGNDGDLVIKHTGSDSIIETHATDSAGDLYIKSQGTNHDLYLQAADDIFIRPQNGENGIYIQGNGGVAVYHNNAVKLETTSTGIDVTGEVKADSLDIDGDADISGQLTCGRILATAPSTGIHQLINASTNATVLQLISTGDNPDHALNLQTDHIYTSGLALHIGIEARNIYLRGAQTTVGTTTPVSGYELTVSNGPGKSIAAAGEIYAPTVEIGSALLSSASTTSATTTTTVSSVAKATYNVAFFDYSIKNGTNVRAGTVVAAHDGTNVEFNETSTVDLGDTSDVTLSVDISGSDMRLRATTTSSTWTIKSFIRSL